MKDSIETMTDQRGNILRVGDWLSGTQYPKTCQVQIIKIVGGVGTFQWEHGGFYNSDGVLENTFRLTQECLSTTKWLRRDVALAETADDQTEGWINVIRKGDVR